jgi:RNA polymerase sigma-70 factor (ECF subfamily)
VDAATIERARRGDRAARDAILRELQDPWFRFCMSLLGDAESARDATQETALRFLSRLSQFRGDSSLLTWSMGIALNVVREMRRTRRGESLEASGAEEFQSADSSSPIADAQQTELRAVMQDLLRELPDRQREAIVLRFFQELNVDDTAAAMNCAPGTVKATVHQALRRLRSKLNQFA